ncbi:MAG: hypothetical protein Q9213_004203 [Squamulea squamosa]
MAPSRPSYKARRLTWNHNMTSETSEDYGQEILPTIDMDALAQLPSHERETFKEMRAKDRLRVLARWKKEGHPMPQISSSPTDDTTAKLIRTSSAPQLPELQMDASIGSFAGAIEPADAKMPASTEVPANPARLRTTEHFDINRKAVKGHHGLGFTPSLLSIRSKSSQPELYKDETPEKRCLRKLQRDQVALQNIVNKQDREWCRFRGVGAVPPGLGLSAHSPSAADRVNARTITRKNAVAQATGQQLNAYGTSDPIPLADLSLLTYAIPDTLGIAQDIDGEERTLRATNGSPDLHSSLFVRAITPVAAPARSLRTAGKKRLRPLHIRRVPPPDGAGSASDKVQPAFKDTQSDTPEELLERDNVHTSSGTRVGKKIEASTNWIKNVFKSKTERKKKARTPGRPLSRAHLHEEAQVGTATRVSMLPVKAPQPRQPSPLVEQLRPNQRPPSPPSPPYPERPLPSLQSSSGPSYLQRPPPSLQASNQSSPSRRSSPNSQNAGSVIDARARPAERGRSSTRKTTRAMMEGYD